MQGIILASLYVNVVFSSNVPEPPGLCIRNKPFSIAICVIDENISKS